MRKRKVTVSTIMLILISVILMGCSQSNNTEQASNNENSNKNGNEGTEEKIELVLSHTAAHGTPVRWKESEAK
jgi:ABC-type Fe3+-citrate transport system substrate-binding protein